MNLNNNSFIVGKIQQLIQHWKIQQLIHRWKNTTTHSSLGKILQTTESLLMNV